jgi:hypothetical protein
MRSRLLIKTPEQGHSYHSPQSTHIWIEISRTKYNIMYECAKCSRHHQRKLAGGYKKKKMRKIRRLMARALGGE